MNHSQRVFKTGKNFRTADFVSISAVRIVTLNLIYDTQLKTGRRPRTYDIFSIKMLPRDAYALPHPQPALSLQNYC